MSIWLTPFRLSVASHRVVPDAGAYGRIVKDAQGSVQRIVEARDAKGAVHHLPVDAKGFDGESMTISSADALAYQDIGDIKEIKDFPGLKRDGQVPAGDRIFRLPYLDPQGQMTIAQWNTASFGPDYRLKPLQAVNESRSQAAEMLGISIRTLRNKLKEYREANTEGCHCAG